MLVAQEDLVVQYVQHYGAHAASLSIGEVTADCKTLWRDNMLNHEMTLNYRSLNVNGRQWSTTMTLLAFKANEIYSPDANRTSLIKIHRRSNWSDRRTARPTRPGTTGMMTCLADSLALSGWYSWTSGLDAK